jgi:RecJ-like exonuclease
MKEYKCVTCDGTGEVHSHNPKCWDCNGYGYTDRETAERGIRHEILPAIAYLKWLAKEKFETAEQNQEVSRLLNVRLK